jgi:hypothetical protein
MALHTLALPSYILAESILLPKAPRMFEEKQSRRKCGEDISTVSGDAIFPVLKT